MKPAVLLLSATALAVALLVSGCATPVGTGAPAAAGPRETGFSASDLDRMAVSMLESMLAAFPPPSDGSRPVLVVESIRNRTRRIIDTQSIANSIRMQLVRSGRFAVLDRPPEASSPQELSCFPYLATHPDRPDYMLGATLLESMQKDGNNTKVFFKFTLNLRNFLTGIIEWADERTLCWTEPISASAGPN